MAFHFLLQLLLLISIFNLSLSTRTRFSETQDQSMLLTYHNGPLLKGKISINLIWYGKFSPSQCAIVTDLITSLSSSPSKTNTPSVSTWWTTLEKKYSSLSLKPVLGKTQVIDDKYSLGKSLTMKQIERLASRGGQRDSVNVVLTSDDVAVVGFCISRCGTHGSVKLSKGGRFAYIWVGNSETQCPGQCAWPFHQPMYGPQTAPLVAPNNDVGMDGMTVNLATLLAGAVTNPFGNGYFEGPSDAPLEAASACTGVYGKGAYPGYAGELLVDTSTGGSYNAHGVNGRKFLLPALFDPSTSSCSTLV